jgi:bifunctional DNA-binding transcriptional regulator/antitoxin component of YhaV-PrlF toxin-antitoxin module
MERLVVNTEGQIIIPPAITQKHGLRPGDELSLVETANGLLVRVDDAEAWAWAQSWWNSLTTEQQRAARQEAETYEALSEEERDAIWNQFPESIAADAEGDELDLSTLQRSA